MVSHDLVSSTYSTPNEFFPGYWTWDITSNGSSLDAALKKMITDEGAFSVKSIYHNDLSLAMNLFYEHDASNGKIPFEIRLRYLENEKVQYILCKGQITEWSVNGRAEKMSGYCIDITKLVERKNLLNLENERYRLLTDSINAGIWDWNIKTGEQWWSDKLYHLLGYTRGEIESTYEVFQNVLLHPDDRQKSFNAMTNHLHNKTPYVLVVRIKNKDGNYLWYEITGKVERNKDGEPERMVGAVINKHDRKVFQLELEKKQQLLDEVSELCKIGIWESDMNTGMCYWSKGMYDIHELPYDFIPTIDSLKQFHAGEDFNALMEPFNTCIEEGRSSYDFIASITSKNGNRKWLHFTGMILRDENNNITGAKGLAQDITVQETKARMMKQYQAELERSEILLNETGSMARVGGWEFDLRSGTVNWTKEVYKIHEISTSVVPDFEIVQSCYPEESRKILTQAVEECINNKKEYDFEVMIQTPEGNKKWIRAIGKPIVDETGSVIMLRGTVQDIDEIKKKELEFQKSVNIIHSQNERLNNYAHIVSHNLRTHSGNIDSILNMIEESDDADEKRGLMEHLRKISNALSDTVQHLNDVAKIQKEIHTAKVSISFSDVFNRTKDVLMPTINETNATIEADFSRLESIHYIPAYLESILLNLLSNGIKYRHPQRAPYITVKSFVKDDTNYLQVSDNGLGIDVERFKSKLFGMYQTFHNNTDARGIGLFITKSQLEALGGSINVTSTPGEGSTFLVQF